ADIRTKAITEHLGKSGALDVIDVSPAWIPEFADRGVILPIDDLIKKYKVQATLNDLHPLYRLLGKYKGKNWGFFADGDVWSLYYRKDIFGNAKLRKAYKAKYKRDLRPPKTWNEFTETAQFITDQMAPKVYGAGEGRALGNPGNQFYFFQTFRAFGGHLYDPDGRQGDADDHEGAEGVRTGHREARLRLLVGPVAQREDGDDLRLAAHGPHLRELRAAGQGVCVPAEVEGRRQGRLLAHACEERRARRQLRAVHLGRLEESRGGVPLQLLDHEPVDLVADRDAA
ncbi:MAG: extracellular solute-binding protein, partial [Actinobacteria bacterium]